MDPLRNPKDPLLKLTPKSAQELLRKISSQCDQYSLPTIIDACMSMVIAVVRQNKSTRDEAEKAMQEIYGNTMKALMEHYDSVGRKKGIFPYSQTIVIPKRIN